MRRLFCVLFQLIVFKNVYKIVIYALDALQLQKKTHSIPDIITQGSPLLHDLEGFLLFRAHRVKLHNDKRSKDPQPLHRCPDWQRCPDWVQPESVM